MNVDLQNQFLDEIMNQSNGEWFLPTNYFEFLI
jgi:hypothetical protein